MKPPNGYGKRPAQAGTAAKPGSATKTSVKVDSTRVSLGAIEPSAGAARISAGAARISADAARRGVGSARTSGSIGVGGPADARRVSVGPTQLTTGTATNGRHSGIGMTSARTRERLVQRLRDQGIANPVVLDQIRNVPRHLFVDEALATRAYEDTALPIGLGQTISQPYVVARMTEALIEGTAPRKVLEIGTGCGYQTAVLAPLVKFLYSIERISALLERARLRFKELNIRNVHLRHGDGFQGWTAHAPYDGILMAAAPLAIPEVLFTQLAPGGRLIAPVGPEGRQQLLRITRRAEGRGEEFHVETLGLVSFVPLLKGLG